MKEPENTVEKLTEVLKSSTLGGDFRSVDSALEKAKKKYLAEFQYSIVYTEYIQQPKGPWDFGKPRYKESGEKEEPIKFKSLTEAMEYYQKIMKTNPCRRGLGLVYFCRNGIKGRALVLPWKEIVWVDWLFGIEEVNTECKLAQQCKENPDYTFARLLEVWWHLTPELYREQTGRDLEYVSKINVGW